MFYSLRPRGYGMNCETLSWHYQVISIAYKRLSPRRDTIFPLITIAFAKGGDSKVDVVIHLSLEIRCSYMRYK